MELTLGPLYFNWPAEKIAAFYARIADEAPVERVYLGEVVCGKRAPLYEHVLAEAAERLVRAGKTVVWSGLAMPSTPRERRLMAEMAAEDALVEVNDISMLAARAGRPYVAGPLLNVYNEAAAAELTARGCTRLCANVELPLASVAAIARALPGLEMELFAFGRLPLALAGRCHHAKAHGLHKDACQYVCGEDTDGMAVLTLDGEGLFAVNGVQTLSFGVQAATLDAAELRRTGVTALRLSPQDMDMVAVAAAFRSFADGDSATDDLRRALLDAGPCGPLVGGYLRGAAGAAPLEAGMRDA